MLNRSHYILIALNALYLVPFAVHFLIRENYEFLGYIVQVVLLGTLLFATLRKTQFPLWLLVLLSVWALFHVLGGGVVVGEEVLYRYKFFHLWSSGEDYILKYDQVIHYYGFMVATFVAYYLLRPQLKVGARVGAVAFVAMLAGMGFGAANEMVEFAAVILAPETGVGGYLNTSIDLVANALGALTAALILAYTKVGRLVHERA